MPISAAALQFSLAHPAVAAIIPDASRPERIAEDHAAAGFAVPADFWRATLPYPRRATVGPALREGGIVAPTRRSRRTGERDGPFIRDAPTFPSRRRGVGLSGNYNSLPDWLPYIPSSRLAEGGRVRHLENSDGSAIVEQLMALDETARSRCASFWRRRGASSS